MNNDKLITTAAPGGKIEEEVTKTVSKNVTKTPSQLTWENVTITAIPPKKRCGKGKNDPVVPKEIIRGVSGTVKPGQFLAIIGASGKYAEHSLTCLFSRLWKDHYVELPFGS